MSRKNPRQPQCLVAVNEKGDPTVNENAIQEIRRIEKPLVVLAVLGQFKSGKSHLLNRLFLDREIKFDVGHGLDPTTYGIWSTVIDHPKLNEYKLVILDTEGFRKIAPTDRQVEKKISAVALCVSSAIIWNGKFAICESDVKMIGSIAETAAEVAQVHHQISPARIPATTLAYAVQDFSLRRKWDDRSLTGDEYLEETLKIDNKSDETSSPSLIRKRIKETFPQRRCFTVPTPVRDSKKLKHLDQLSDEDLVCRYLSKLEDMRVYLLSSATPVTVGGSVMTGGEWANHLQHCVEIARIPDAIPTPVSNHHELHGSDRGVRESQRSISKLTINERFQSVIGSAVERDETRFREITRELRRRLFYSGFEAFRWHAMCTETFVTAVLNDRGGLITFADRSVKLDVPPRALQEPTVVYCHRSVHVTPKTDDVILYSIPIRCGPEEVELNRPIQLTFRHFANIENKSQENMISVFTKRHNDQQFQVDEAAQIQFEGDLVKLRIPHFSDVVIGTVLSNPDFDGFQCQTSDPISPLKP